MNSVVRYRASSFKPHFWAQARNNNNNNKKNHPKKLSYISANGTF